MSDEDPENVFEEIYSDYDLHLKDKTTVVKAGMIKKYLRPKSRILILGCGPCFEGKVLKDDGHYVVAVDIADRYSKMNKANFDEFHKADVSKRLDFKSVSFDAVIAFELIEHLAFVDSFISECHRVLKRKGLLILSTPSQSYWKDRIKLLLGKDILSDNHPRTFTPRTLEAKLGKFFTIRKMDGVGRLGFALSTRFPALSVCGDFLVVANKK